MDPERSSVESSRSTGELLRVLGLAIVGNVLGSEGPEDELDGTGKNSTDSLLSLEILAVRFTGSVDAEAVDEISSQLDI